MSTNNAGAAAEDHGTQFLCCCINPTLNRHPRTAPPFLEVRHLAENNDAFAVRTVPDRKLRSVRGISGARLFRIDSAAYVAALTLKIIRSFHAL
jgi:hypothetical protein